VRARELSTWRVAGRLVRYRPGLFALCVLQMVAWNGATLLIGWLLQQLFDTLSGEAMIGLGTYGILAVLAGAEAANLAVIWAGAVRTRCWEYMRGLLRLNLLRAQLSSGGPEAGVPAGSPSEAVSRFRDDVDDFLSFLETALQTAGKVALLGGAMIIMISIEPVIAVAVVLPLVAVVIATRLATGRIRKNRAAYRHASAAVTSLLGEIFGAILTVKSAQAGSGILERLARLNDRRRRAGLRDELVTRLLGTFNRTTVDVTVGVVLLLAVPAMHRGDFTIGDLALFITYVGSLVWLPVYGGRLLAKQRQAGVAVDRMASLVPQASPATLVVHRPITDPEPPARMERLERGALECLTVSGLTAVHPTSGRGIHDVSLVLGRGTFTVVTGPAGAGKTTLLRAILGLLPVQAGTLAWNGVVVDDPAGFFVPPRSAYVPQAPRLFSETLRDNLKLAIHDPSELTTAVRTAVLDQDIAAMPDGLDTEVGAHGVRLSGGQVQRAAIARALVPRSKLLVLDDVSSALDVETERRLWDRLRARHDQTLLVVSNRPATIARADQVIRLDHGRVQPGSLHRQAAALPEAA
jgi:ATP-binding cassette subfamily B protein